MLQQALVMQLLGRTDLFGALHEPDLLGVARQMRPANFVKGQMIFARGEPGRNIYLVVEGRVRFSVVSMEGRALSFNHAGKGELFGEIAALDHGLRTADAVALTRVQTMMLSQAALVRSIEASPRVAEAVIAFLCRRLRVMTERSEMIALYPVEVRLARLLWSAMAQQAPLKVDAPIALNLEMSQNELALLIGASRQKVNDALHCLEQRGALRRKGRMLICDAQKLGRFADMP